MAGIPSSRRELEKAMGMVKCVVGRMNEPKLQPSATYVTREQRAGYCLNGVLSSVSGPSGKAAGSSRNATSCDQSEVALAPGPERASKRWVRTYLGRPAAGLSPISHSSVAPAIYTVVLQPAEASASDGPVLAQFLPVPRSKVPWREERDPLTDS